MVGFHGQTVLHRPELKLTVQIGDGVALRQRLGIPVVHDLRQADIAAGGQGAPLVPVFHRALADAAGLPRPLAVVNIGGVANVTFIGADGGLLAFDTGPGNALLDDWMAERTGTAVDAGGATAARGRPDEPSSPGSSSTPISRGGRRNRSTATPSPIASSAMSRPRTGRRRLPPSPRAPLPAALTS